MKEIKLKFVDMWSSFDPERSPLYLAFLHSGYPIRLCEKDPDYLVCSLFGHEALRPCYDDCIKIVRSGESYCPDFNLYDYAIAYETLSFGDRYLQAPAYFLDPPANRELFCRMQEKHLCVEEALQEKSAFCSFVYSNSATAHPLREELFHRLSQYRKVNSGGRFLNNIGMPDGVPDKLEFQRKHKFVIACENDAHPGYTTEKLLDAFAAHAVPIYWGDPQVCERFNPKAMIRVQDYPTLDALVERVREVDNDDELYARMLAEPAMLDFEPYTPECYQAQLDAFIKHILDQPKEDAFRRNRWAYGKNYLKEHRQAFFSNTATRPQSPLLWQGFKRLVPKSVKQRLKNAWRNRK